MHEINFNSLLTFGSCVVSLIALVVTIHSCVDMVRTRREQREFDENIKREKQ